MSQGFKFMSVLCIIFLIAGCDQFNQYKVSEDEINQSLNQQQKFVKNLGISGLFDVDFTVTHLESRIGRDKLGFVTLNGNGQIKLTSLLGNQELAIQLTVSARPAFNKEKSAIYLQDLSVAVLKVQPDKLTKIVKNLEPLINRALSDYFAQKPAYALSSKHSWKEGVIKNFVSRLEVHPGSLVITLGH